MRVEVFAHHPREGRPPRISVVVPARNERARLPRLLRSLEQQTDRRDHRRLDFQVVVLANGSSDDTEAVAQEHLQKRDLPGTVLRWSADEEPNIGLVRRELMAHALRSMRVAGALDQPPSWVAWTDADCVVAEDWIAQTDSLFQRGFGAVAGHVAVDDRDDGEARRLHGLRYQYHTHFNRLWRELSRHPDDRLSDHHFNCGASLAFAVEAYRSIEPVPALAYEEDKVMWNRIAESGFRTVRSDRVRVVTSARKKGRCRAGLASQLDDLESPQRRQRWMQVPSLESVVNLIQASNQIEACWRPHPPSQRISAFRAWQARMQESLHAWPGVAHDQLEKLTASPLGFRSIQAKLRCECMEFLPKVSLSEALARL